MSKTDKIVAKALKNVKVETIKAFEQRLKELKQDYKEQTGEDYDPKKKEDYAMAKVLTRIYGKSKNAIVSYNEYIEIVKESGYHPSGASALFKKHLVKLAWDRVGLTKFGQLYVEALNHYLVK